MPDLLVGAPFYFSDDSGGAVYLYLNINHNLTSQFNLKLTGKPESQFGISIANAGDLNKDGCEDIAIGSPYEGNGVVYIHMGDREVGLKSKPNQIIRAESLPRVMRTFGYSLSGGLDLDSNGYPDLLVGAYENVRFTVCFIMNYVTLRFRNISEFFTHVHNFLFHVTEQHCINPNEANYRHKYLDQAIECYNKYRPNNTWL